MTERDPDHAEQEHAADLGDGVPASGYHLLPVVGLGGSAGGIFALKSLFEAMPADPGLAFVVVMHLSPEHGSTLAELLQRSTKMPVEQVTGHVKVEANKVYVIPPRLALKAVGDALE